MFKIKNTHYHHQKDCLEYILHDILKKCSSKPLELFFSNAIIRKHIMRLADKKIHLSLLRDQKFPQKVQKDKYYMSRAAMSAINKGFEKANNAPNVRRAVVNALVLEIFLKRKRKAHVEKYKKQHGFGSPLFLTIAANKLCNLKCIGCYANSSSANSEKLSWDVLNRIIKEKTNLWGSYFTTITGGEPLLYQEQGKTIIDLAKEHQDNYFLMYTNGTLITKEIAKKLAEVGNITPAISVEGFEKETDARRGKGVHKRILQAMENLREVGVPFGISITASGENADWILNDKTFDYYFDELGAIYSWVFQLMPIGRANLDLMVSPKQRIKMLRQTQHLVKDRRLFVADFWNSGCVSDGCISAGRHGGYLYIDWNGNVTPCVFNPYSPVNINEVYKKGGTLDDVLKEPFFKSIRQWQRDYALDKKPDKMGNWLIPCPIKDHYNMMKKLLNKHRPKPIDEAAQKALKDIEYQKGMEKYGQKAAGAIDPIWEKEYLRKGGEKL